MVRVRFRVTSSPNAFGSRRGDGLEAKREGRSAAAGGEVALEPPGSAAPPFALAPSAPPARRPPPASLPPARAPVASGPLVRSMPAQLAPTPSASPPVAPLQKESCWTTPPLRTGRSVAEPPRGTCAIIGESVSCDSSASGLGASESAGASARWLGESKGVPTCRSRASLSLSGACSAAAVGEAVGEQLPST